MRDQREGRRGRDGEDREGWGRRREIYRIAEKFGGGFNLAIWWYRKKSPN